MRFSLRLLLFGVMPCFAVVFTIWTLTGYIRVPYIHRDLFLLFRVVLCFVVAVSWVWTTRELIRWRYGNAATQRAYMAWMKRRQ